MRSVVFLVGVTWLFTFPIKTLAQSPGPCLKIKQFWTSYDALRQNSAMDVKLVWKAQGCLIPAKVNGKPEPSNITVAVQNIPGLDAQFFGNTLDTGKADVARELEVNLYLKASSELPLGPRMFLVRIDYDAFDHTHKVHRERVFTPIFVRVVSPNTPIKGGYEPSSPWRLLLLPVNILEYIVEALTGQIC